jgi:hypothetical protein
MAKVFADAGSDVTIHARRPEVVAETNVRHQNARYLPDVVLPDPLRATVDPVETLAGARHVVLSIPAQALRANLAAWAPHIEPDAVVVSSMKGVETYSGLQMGGDPPGHGHPVRADRGAVRAEPGPGDRRWAARRVRDRLTRRDGGRRAAEGVPHPVLPPLHGHGRGGL